MSSPCSAQRQIAIHVEDVKRSADRRQKKEHRGKQAPDRESGDSLLRRRHDCHGRRCNEWLGARLRLRLRLELRLRLGRRRRHDRQQCILRRPAFPAESASLFNLCGAADTPDHAGRMHCELQIEPADADDVAVAELMRADAAPGDDHAIPASVVDDFPAGALMDDLRVAARDLPIIENDVVLGRAPDPGLGAAVQGDFRRRIAGVTTPQCRHRLSRSKRF